MPCVFCHNKKIPLHRAVTRLEVTLRSRARPAHLQAAPPVLSANIHSPPRHGQWQEDNLLNIRSLNVATGRQKASLGKNQGLGQPRLQWSLVRAPERPFTSTDLARPLSAPGASSPSSPPGSEALDLGLPSCPAHRQISFRAVPCLMPASHPSPPGPSPCPL